MLTGPDPIAELIDLLEKEGLPSRFQRLLVSVFRRICDGAYFPAQDLLETIERKGAISFVRDWLTDDRSQPALELLCERNRVEFAVEWLVTRVPYRELFSRAEQDLAGQHLAAVPGHPGVLYERVVEQEPSEGAVVGSTVLIVDPDFVTPERVEYFKYFPKWEDAPSNESERAALAIEHLATDGTYTPGDLADLQRRRLQDSHPMPINERVDHLEREIQQGYPFTCSAEVFTYVLAHREDVHEKAPGVAGVVLELDRSIPGYMEPVLQVLRPVLDLSEEKAAVVSNRIRRSKSEASQILALRAALACVNLSNFTGYFVQLFFGEADSVPYYLPACFTEYFETTDAQLLNIARITSFLLPCEVLSHYIDEVVSFGDIPAVSIGDQILARTATDDDIRLFEEYENVEIQGRPDADIESIILFVHTQVIQTERLSSEIGVEGSVLPIRTSEADRTKSIDPVQLASLTAQSELFMSELFMRVLGPERAAEAERRVRADMGPLFDLLCPKAKAALNGAEYTLMDGWHPAPSQAIIGISVAFENQLKESFLGPLAEYVWRTGQRTFPKDDKTTLVKDGRVLEKPIEQILRALRTHDPLWDDFSSACGFDLSILRRTLEGIKDIRNEAAHKGGLAHEDTKQYRKLWLHPTRGIFAVLFPSRH